MNIIIYSTAGMRIASPDEREELHDRLEKYLKARQYKTIEIGMLKGSYEGFFAWISVNYLKGTFEKNKKKLISVNWLN